MTLPLSKLRASPPMRTPVCQVSYGNSGQGATMTKWTAEKDEQLRSLHGEGVSFSEMAEKLGITKSAAISRAHRLGLWREDKPPRPRRRACPRALVPSSLPPIRPGEPVSLFYRTSDGCCFIVADPYLYCPERRSPRSAYCAKHYAVVWRRPVFLCRAARP